MLTKFQVWDFDQRINSLLKSMQPASGVRFFSFYCKDPFLGQLLLHHWKIEFLKSSPSTQLVTEMASSLTTEWIENHLLTHDLFSSQNCYWLLMADEMPNHAKALFLESSPETISSPYLFFIFNKDDVFFKKLATLSCTQAVMIEEVRFWEMRKLLDYFCRLLGLHKMPLVVKECILELVDHHAYDLYQSLNLLKLSLPHLESEWKVEMVQQVLGQERVDQFALVGLLADREMAKFIQQLLVIRPDFEELRNFFAFAQSYFWKMLDLQASKEKEDSNLAQDDLEDLEDQNTKKNTRPFTKEKLTRYDQEVLHRSGGWDRQSIKDILRFLGILEKQSKEKNPFLYDSLRMMTHY